MSTTKITLSKEDQKIAEELQKITGNFEDIECLPPSIESLETSTKNNKTGGNIVLDKPISIHGTIGSSIIDGNDRRRLLSDLLD